MIYRRTINTMAVCRFCGEERVNLIKSHVIPRSFFKLVKKDAPYAVFFQAREQALRTDYKQAGIYDDQILCETCETEFTAWDTHGYDVLSKVRNKEEACRDEFGRAYGVLLRDLDYEVFKLFILSVLWRASVSSHSFYAKVQLGPHEDRIRDLLKEKRPIDPEEYSVILLLPMGQPFANTMLTPFPSRIGDVLFYRLYFPNVIALVKVDRRKTPGALGEIQLRPDRENAFIFQPHRGSPEDHFFKGLHAFMKKHDLFGKDGDRTQA